MIEETRQILDTSDQNLNKKSIIIFFYLIMMATSAGAVGATTHNHYAQEYPLMTDPSQNLDSQNEIED
jgi:hypothetical protein